jgi:hypothetical protein
MIVSELIAQLQTQNPNAEIIISFPLGDYGRNEGGEHISQVAERPVRESGYLSEFIVDDEAYDNEDCLEDEGCNCDTCEGRVSDKVVIS